MKHIGKSLLLAFMETGLLFFFLMMGAVPILALLSRLSGDVTQKSVVVNPGLFLRAYGVPIAIAAFVVFFAISEYRFRVLARKQLSAPHGS